MHNSWACLRNCPMSLDVQSMAKVEAMANSECVLCGMCVDHCPGKSIRSRFSSGK